MCCDSPTPPDPNPGMIESAEAARDVAKMQQETAMEYLNFSKEQYADLAPFLKDIAETQSEMMKSNQARADEYAEYERTTFRPLEQDLVDKANSFDTEAERERLASQGMADVATAYEQQRQQALDTLSRYGINPNSARFAAINAQLAGQEAGARAGAANRSRWMADDKATALKYDAAALGRGLATNASTAYGVATSAGNSAAGNASSGMNMMGNAYGQASNILGGATQAYGTAGNIYGQEFNARMQGFNAAQSQDSGFGSLLGFGARILAAPATGGVSMASKMFGFADGGQVHLGKGKVEGPGGPVDDQVPAMLSDGEYVLPADTVKAIGKKKLDKLVKETHTPAAVQRRQAIKRSA